MGDKKKKNDKKNNNKNIIIGVVVAVVIILILLFFLLGKKDKVQYKVTFNSEGSELSTIMVDEDGKIVKPEDPTKEGYAFDGWYLNGEPFDFDQEVSGNIELEARWTKIEEVSVSGVELNKSSLTLNVGDEKSLVATVSPSDATNKNVTWTSSDETVASVNRGEVTALKEGTVTITATSRNYSDVSATIILTFTPSDDPVATKDWPNMPFASHTEYVAAEDETPITLYLPTFLRALNIEPPIKPKPITPIFILNPYD